MYRIHQTHCFEWKVGMHHLDSHQEEQLLEDQRNQRRQTIEFVELVYALRSLVVGLALRSRQKGMNFVDVEVRERTIAVEGMEGQIALWEERQREERMAFAPMGGKVKGKLVELVQMELVSRILLEVAEKYTEQE